LKFGENEDDAVDPVLELGVMAASVASVPPVESTRQRPFSPMRSPTAIASAASLYPVIDRRLGHGASVAAVAGEPGEEEVGAEFRATMSGTGRISPLAAEKPCR
jgi:hypothetical protein